MKDATIRQFLKIQFEHDQKLRKHEDALSEGYFWVDLLDAILTDLDFPEDNTVSAMHDTHPEDLFCRDIFYDRFREIIHGADQEFRDYINFLREYKQEYQTYLKEKG